MASLSFPFSEMLYERTFPVVQACGIDGAKKYITEFSQREREDDAAGAVRQLEILRAGPHVDVLGEVEHPALAVPVHGHAGEPREGPVVAAAAEAEVAERVGGFHRAGDGDDER